MLYPLSYGCIIAILPFLSTTFKPLPANTPEAASLPIVSIGIACPMAIQNIESFLLLIICLHRHNGAARLKLLLILSGLFFRYAHGHKCAKKPASYCTKRSTKSRYQNTACEGRAQYRNEQRYSRTQQTSN